MACSHCISNHTKTYIPYSLQSITIFFRPSSLPMSQLPWGSSIHCSFSLKCSFSSPTQLLFILKSLLHSNLTKKLYLICQSQLGPHNHSLTARESLSSQHISKLDLQICLSDYLIDVYLPHQTVSWEKGQGLYLLCFPLYH